MKKILFMLIAIMLVFSGLGVGALKDFEQNTQLNGGYDMVIIAPLKFKLPAQSLIKHKNNDGVQTTFKSTKSIYNEYNGRDEAEDIKLFIKDAIEELHVKYVLLLGGRSVFYPKWNVPVRYVELDDGTQRYTRFFSDLYYADIYKDGGTNFEDWDSNGDDIFAEWGKDQMDLHPDVYVGRLPCRTFIDARIVTKKIIEYENSAYGQQWFNKFVLIGGDTFPDYPGYEGEETCDFVAGYMDDFEKNKTVYIYWKSNGT